MKAKLIAIVLLALQGSPASAQVGSPSDVSPFTIESAETSFQDDFGRPLTRGDAIAGKTFDESGLVIEAIWFDWTDNEWQNSTKHLNSYDEYGNLTASVTTEWSGSDWVNATRSERAYDESWNLSEIVFQTWTGLEWENTSRSQYSYDGSGNQTELKSQNWTGGSWENTRRYLREYDAEGRQTSSTTQSWDGSNWENERRSLTEFDPSADQTDSRTQIWDGNEWETMIHFRSFQTYDEAGNLVESTSQDSTEAGWTNSSRTVYTYDPLGRLKDYMWHYWDGAEWVPSQGESFAYDALGHVTVHTWFQFDWFPYQRIVDLYDDQGLRRESLHQDYDLSVGWVNTNRGIFTYGPAPALPDQVELISPEEGIEGVGPYATLEWSPSSGAMRYHLQIDTDARFPNPIVNDSMLAATTDSLDVPLPYESTFFWRVRGSNQSGFGPWSEIRAFTVAVGTSVEEESGVPGRYALEANYPNPFNPSTVIGFTLPEAVNTRLTVLDALGRILTTLVDGPQSAGSHTAEWHAGQAASGLYFYRLEAGPFAETRPMYLIR
jgi:hypothetical protein